MPPCSVGMPQTNTSVTIQGTSLLGGGNKITSVKLGAVPVLQIVSFSDSKIAVIAGDSNGNNGIVSIAIESDSGSQAAKAAAFEYVQAGSIATVYHYPYPILINIS